MPLLTRKAQIALEVEGTEGTAETLIAADATMIPYDPDFSPNAEIFTRDPARSTLSRLTGIVGKQTGTISWKTELKGSGTKTTRPAWDDAIRCCGFTSISVAAVTVTGMTGTFQPGETFTVTTTSQTGRVVGKHHNDTIMYFVNTSSQVPSGATIVGGTSGASCVASAAGVTGSGFEYRPISASDPSATVALYRDGMKHMIVGARGNVSIEGNVGEPVFLNFSFEGVYSAVTDADLLVPTYESTVPPALLNAQTMVDGLTAVYSQFGIDCQNTLSQREDANSTKGVLSVMITERAPRLTIDPEMVLVASKDFYGRMVGATTGWFAAKVGSTAANTIVLGAPKIQYVGVGQGDRNSLSVANLEFDLVAASVSTGDNELQIAMI